MFKKLLIIYFKYPLFLFFILFYGLSYANTSVTKSTLSFYDSSRQRLIPVTTYVSSSHKWHNSDPLHPVIIINHGYTAKHTEYSFLAEMLAMQGYFVVSIQHELPSDPPLAHTGNLYQLRKPVWENGVKNIKFIIQTLKMNRKDLNLTKVTLIGHSNGGDMIMLFATKYPQSVAALIDLDSLRIPFPKNGLVPILTIRANDTKADKNVLPLQNHQKNITIVQMKRAHHIDLCDRGSEQIKKKINHIVWVFLRNNIST